MDAKDPCSDVPYDLGVEEVRRALEEARGSGPVVVQLPDGMKPLAGRVVECLRGALGVDVVVHGDSVFGACDLQWEKLARLRPRLVVHYGHTPYPPELADGSDAPGPYVFVPAYSRLEVPEEAVAEAAEVLRSRGARRVAVTASVQHTPQARRVARGLEAHGLEALVPRGRPPFFEDGQVLGCDYRVALRARGVDAYVFVGGGLFHPLGLYLATRRPVVKVDPYRGRAVDVTPEGERVLRVRLFKVSQAMGATRWLVVAGLKSGQYRPWLLATLRGALERRGLQHRVVAMESTSLEALRALDDGWAEAVVVTSCPRLPIDDLSEYHRPVLTPGEAFMALEGRLEPYRFPW